jgi:hypothetical protein
MRSISGGGRYAGSPTPTRKIFAALSIFRLPTRGRLENRRKNRVEGEPS